MTLAELNALADRYDQKAALEAQRLSDGLKDAAEMKISPQGDFWHAAHDAKRRARVARAIADAVAEG